jgi:hypothetical protein
MREIPKKHGGILMLVLIVIGTDDQSYVLFGR